MAGEQSPVATYEVRMVTYEVLTRFADEPKQWFAWRAVKDVAADGARLSHFCDLLWGDYCIRQGHASFRTDDRSGYELGALDPGWGLNNYTIRRASDGELLDGGTLLSKLLPDGGRIEVRLVRKEAAQGTE